tara:strand:+ start:493 stop:726 length:234 start_codon:yes stop_codon:yes gene_type:complete
MIKWLFKKINSDNSEITKLKNERSSSREYADGIEKSLWEIKEVYDLPTEEVAMTVRSKRENLQYMHKILKNNHKDVK